MLAIYSENRNNNGNGSGNGVGSGSENFGSANGGGNLTFLSSRQHNGQNLDSSRISTKQRILNCAATLFASKGFTETSIRELAAAVGLQGSSIYNHFPSKTAILEYMLDEFIHFNYRVYFSDRTRRILEENPTTEGILSCLKITLENNSADYYFKLLSTIMQEQHRIPDVNEYVRDNIMQSEHFIQIIIDTLKDLNKIRRDMNPDFWMKTASSIFYAFSNRSILGCGDESPNYKGMGMMDLLGQLFDTMFAECGVSAN